MEECEALCSADDSCNAIEVNGCLSGGAQCGGACYTFEGAGTEITNGKCVTSGDQKAYRKPQPQEAEELAKELCKCPLRHVPNWK